MKNYIIYEVDNLFYFNKTMKPVIHFNAKLKKIEYITNDNKLTIISTKYINRNKNIIIRKNNTIIITYNDNKYIDIVYYGDDMLNNVIYYQHNNYSYVQPDLINVKIIDILLKQSKFNKKTYIQISKKISNNFRLSKNITYFNNIFESIGINLDIISIIISFYI